MTSDIIANLELDKKFIAKKVIVAKEINGCDSTFLIGCLLGHCIKNKHAVVIVSTHNSLLHYHNVGLKMNYNLRKYVDSGLIEFYNLGEEVVNLLLTNEHVSLQHLFIKLKKKVSVLQEKHHVVNIILDGVSHLFNLQYTLKDVNNFCNELIESVRYYSHSFILFHCNVSEDDVTHIMSNLLAHKACIVLEVENLPSGWSTDVSGHLTIRHVAKKFEDEHMFIMEPKYTRYLFKLFDRGVKLFAPGTV